MYITQTWHLSEVVDMTSLPNVTGVCGGHICVQCVWCVCVCVQTAWCQHSAWTAHVSTVRNAVSSEKTRNRMNSPLQTETAGGGESMASHHITNHLTTGRSRDTGRGRTTATH